MQPPEVRGKLILYCFRGGRTGWVEPRARGRTGVLNKVRGKLVLYCFRGGGEGWIESRAQLCPKADEWGGRGATSRRNRIAKACRVWISAEAVAVAEQRVGEDRSPQQRWGGRGATARRNRIAKACRVWISAEDVAVAEQRVGEDRSPQQGIVAVQLLERCRRSRKQAGWQA
jgi:hypothetical protein